MPLSPGRDLGPYRVLGPLGAGGMGEVYRARDTRLGREVAVKVLPADLKGDGRRRRFLQEARAASALNHPHIVTIHELESADGIDFMVMEYVPGRTLEALIPKDGMPVRESLRYSIPIADALAAAHAAGIVHRDIKPANVIVSDQGVVKVLDFGLAKLADDSGAPGETEATLTSPEALSGEGAIAGTAAYMSPEQATGGKVDARSDIFAFGVVLYEMLTGRRPFHGASVSEVRQAVVRDEPRPPRELVAAIPETLERVVLRCLRKEPERRFQHMGDVKLELQELTEDAERVTSRAAGVASPVGASVPARTAGPAPAGRSRRWVLLGSVVLVVGGLLAGLVVRTRARTPPPAARTPEIVPFTSLPGLETVPTFSPDGSQIAFAWNGEGQDGYDLYIKVIGSERLLRLTHNPAVWITAAWSPDGRVIAFRRQAAKDREGSGLFLIPALGGPERKIADGGSPSPLRFLSWSPDGTVLAHATGNSVHLLNVATLESRTLPPPAAECGQPQAAAFSPDGESLASVCLVNEGRMAIFVGPVSGTGARKLATVHGYVIGLGYASDGRHLVYASRGSVWRLSVAGGAPEKLLDDQDAVHPALARAGGRLAYVRGVTNDNVWRFSLDGRLRAAGPPVRLISSSRSQTTPAISPDGRRIAFASNRSGSGEIWVCNADGSDPVAVTNGGAGPGSPVWSPDGDAIAFDSRPSGGAEIFTVRVDGGVPRRVDTGIPDSQVPSFSRDGRWLYFTGGKEPMVRVYKTKHSGGPALALTKGGGYWPRESVDGRRVYYVKAGELWSVSSDGGDESAVPAFPRLGIGRAIDWTVVAGGIYFIDEAGGSPAIAFYDLKATKVQWIVEVPGQPAPWTGGLAVSPDGRSILYSQRDNETADIMLVENFQ